MIRYYAARADEYDDWYLRRGRYSHGPANDASWRSDLEVAAAWLDGRGFRGQIVELAAGTGWWSPLLARHGQLTLYDASAEPLEKARTRLAAAGVTAEFQIRDAWREPDRSVDGLFAGFWISHVDRDRLDEFFGLVARWLVPAGCSPSSTRARTRSRAPGTIDRPWRTSRFGGSTMAPASAFGRFSTSPRILRRRWNEPVSRKSKSSPLSGSSSWVRVVAADSRALPQAGRRFLTPPLLLSGLLQRDAGLFHLPPPFLQGQDENKKPVAPHPSDRLSSVRGPCQAAESG